MKKSKRFLSMVLVFGLCLTMIPSVVMETKAADPVSMMISYVQNRIGKTGRELGYTDEWCAFFVCDSAIYAGQSKAIPYNGNAHTLYFAVLNAGGEKVLSPRAGDIVFYNCTACDTNNDGISIMHVGLVENESYSIEGNLDGSSYSTRTAKRKALTASYSHGSGHSTSNHVKRIYVRPNYSGQVTHTHNYTGERVHEAAHPHAITQRCTNYASCGGAIETGTYAEVKTCKQCWRASFDFSASAVSLKVGESKSISAFIDGCWPDTATMDFDYDTSRIAVTTGQNTITFKGLKAGTCTFKLIIYSDSTKSHIIGSKSISVTVSDPTYTGRVSFDKSSISLVMPTNKTTTLTIGLTGTWPESAGYTFDYNSDIISMSQNGTVLTITAKREGRTDFVMNIVDKNNNNKRITFAVCPITVENAKYTVKYNANGGSGAPSAQTKTYGTPIRISDVVPRRDGYIFKGWATSSTATIPEYVLGDKYKSEASVTLYAVWQKITLTSVKVIPPQKILYYMGESFDASGLKLRLEYSDGSTSVIDSGYSVRGFDSSKKGYKTVTVSYGEKTDSFEVVVKEPTVSLSQKSLTLNVSETKTISAITDPVGCSVKWSVGDNSVVNVSNGTVTAVGVGKTTIEVTFEWQGYYSFATCDVIVKAQTHTVTFVGKNGTVLKTQTVNHGSAATAPTPPAVEGYTFTGWDKKFDKVTSDLTVKAQYDYNGAKLVANNAFALPGQTVQIPVLIQKNPGISGLVLTFQYDKDALSLEGGKPVDGEVAEEFGSVTHAGNSVFVSVDHEDITENGVLVYLPVKIAKDAAFGDYTIDVVVRECVNADRETVELQTVSGKITVVDPASLLYGDVDASDEVDLSDVILLCQYLADFDWDTGISSVEVGLGADADGDTSVDLSDVILLCQYLAEYDYDAGTSPIVLGPKA